MPPSRALLTLLALVATSSVLSAQVAPASAGALAPRFELAGWRLPAAAFAAACWVELDLEGDGERELVVGVHDGPARLWKRRNGVFVEQPELLPSALRSVTAAVAGDFDGDGFEDLFLGRAPSGPFGWPGLDPSAGWDRLWMNRAVGGRRLLVEATWSAGLELFDLLSDPTRANLPHFPLLPRFPVIDFDELRYTHGAIARDFDGDGDLDLALAHGGFDPLARRGVEVEALVLPMPCEVYWNVGDTNGDGFPNFVNDGALAHDDPDSPAIEPPGVLASSVAAGDFDGDGDLDLFFGIMATDRGVHFGNASSGAPNRYYEARRDAQGRMRWTNRSLRALGPQAPSEETRAVFALRLDAGSSLELLTFSFQDARSIGGAWHRHRALRFDRARGAFQERLGAFSGVVATGEELCGGVTALDFDGDGDLDFALSGPRSMLVENRGGSFARVQAPALSSWLQGTAALALGADADGDGIADPGRVPEALVLGGLREQPRWLAPSAGLLEDRTAPGLPLDLGATSAALAADLDGDGRRDVLLLKTDGTLRAWRALDDERFADVSSALPPTSARWIAVNAFDIDGANGVDLLLIESRGAHAWWCNDGRGGFSPRAAPRDPLARELAAARILAEDFDGDGWRDALILLEASDGAAISPLRWRGLGSTGFEDSRALLPSGAATRSALGAAFDADGDARAEILLWDALGAPELWQTTSAGAHLRRAGALPASAVGVGSVAVAHLDGDGVPDLYLAAGDARLAYDRIWRSHVLPGHFPVWREESGHELLAAGASAGTRAAIARFADLDGDGFEDFAIGREGGRSCFHRRLANGGFGPAEAFPDPGDWIGRGWTAFDQDGDGLQELWIYGASQVRSYRHRAAR